MTLRQIRVEGSLAYVQLTKGYVAIIDAADVPLVGGFNWSACESRHTVYAFRTAPKGAPGPRTVQIHRQLLGFPEGLTVDHKSGDGLDNRRANLRLATHRENLCNQRLNAANTSGYRGVSWDKTRQRWHAYIKHHGRRTTLGFFTSVEAAAEAYARASEKLHGEFGRAT